MTTTFDLVKTAVGDPDLTLAIARKPETPSNFDLFDIDLPLPKFGGIPQKWVFAVLDREKAKSQGVRSDSLLAEARAIIGALPRTKLIVLLSDDPTVHLADEFGNLPRDVFCLDYAELPSTKSHRTQPRLSPFILAVQRRFTKFPALARAFSPYQRNTPASGWRFFGREKQLINIIEGNENLVVVGARRVGKTSLLQEAERRLKEDNRRVYYVDVQHCRTGNEVVSEITRVVSPRDAARAFKHHEVLQESVLSNLLRGMASGPETTYLLLDELGNVLAGLPKEDWTFLGLLRKYGARAGLKYVISCFQELFFRQQREFEGPLINFAHTMRLEVFNRKEVEEFVIAPLDFWKPLGNLKGELLDLVISNVGSHPYFLQSFCYALFERFAEDRNFNPLGHANMLLTNDLHAWFAPAVDEIFFRIPSSALRYLFLRRCHEAEGLGQPLNTSEFSDDWLETALNDLGYRSTIRTRRNLLDGLEMHGLCTAVDYDRAKRVVTAPLVYQFVRQTIAPFDSWLAKLAKEIERERDMWDLEKSS
jgi:hypothetical protein